MTDPSPDAEVIHNLSIDSRLAVNAIEDGWVGVTLPGGKEGWIARGFLRLVCLGRECEGDQEFEALLQDRFVLGSPEECYEQLRPYWEELGVNHLIIRTHWAGMPLSTALSSLRLISNELLPELRKV